MTMPNTDERPTPALFDHCANVYKAMEDEATAEADGTIVYEGFTTQLFSGLQLSTPYYTSVMKLLQRMGCVEQLRRGGGNAKSRWRLVRQPDEEAFRVADELVRPAGGKVAMLEQGVGTLNSRISRLEDKVNAIWDHIQTSG